MNFHGIKAIYMFEMARTRRTLMQSSQREAIAGALADIEVDVVIANILAGPLVDLAPKLLECLRTGGDLVLSGILEDQADEVESAYAAHLTGIKRRIDEGWVLLEGRKQ